jgi:tungstate transport system substrate-binding protein
MKNGTTALVAIALAGLIGPAPARAADPPAITLATTTSTRDSGLLEVLIPPFQRHTGVQIKVVAVGSGQALELGRRGDADVLLTHAPDAEEAFMKEGHGGLRLPVMENDFVLLGPPRDPADAASAKKAADAFANIARQPSLFVSRGDRSGTHMKEQEIWKRAGVEPHGDWYLQAGSGMAEILRMAQQKQAYTLSDRGTYLSQRQRLSLKIVCQGDPLLINPYSVIVVRPREDAGRRQQAARRFAQYLVSEPAQAIIGEFGKAEFGQPLFQPAARTSEP